MYFLIISITIELCNLILLQKHPEFATFLSSHDKQIIPAASTRKYWINNTCTHKMVYNTTEYMHIPYLMYNLLNLYCIKILLKIAFSILQKT